MNYTLELTKFRSYLENRVSSGTLELYLHNLKMFFEELDGARPTSENAQAHIDRLEKDGKAPSTVSVRAHAIMRWFKWKGKSIRLDCPTIRIKGPEYLTVEQVEEVLKHCNTLLERVIVTVLFDTAIRISELTNLSLSDVNWQAGLILVTRKGGAKEEVNISPKALGVLGQWIDERRSTSSQVFMDLDRHSAWAILKNLGKRAGTNVHPHIFRHSRAVHLLMNGAELNTVKEHLGHRNISTTVDIYGRFKAVHLKEKVPAW